MTPWESRKPRGGPSKEEGGEQVDPHWVWGDQQIGGDGQGPGAPGVPLPRGQVLPHVLLAGGPCQRRRPGLCHWRAPGASSPTDQPDCWGGKARRGNSDIWSVETLKTPRDILITIPNIEIG